MGEIMRYLALFAILLMAGCVINAPGNQSVNVNQTAGANYSVQVVTYSTSPYSLQGYLYVPSGTGPFPAIIYNHGSEPEPGSKASIGNYFASKGYVAFVPHRGGQGLSEGPYIGDLTDAASQRGQVQTELLAEQADDVEAAVGYVKSLSYVYPDRIAVMGCSYGGIETLLTAERDLGLKAAVDFAGASESWGNTILQERLKQAVDNSTVPIFFLQAENDYHTEPTKVLSAEMIANNTNHEEVEAKIYPPYGTTPEEGHGGFCMNPSIWGEDVLAFIRKFGV
jgi:dienelactone hydrolase